jgi:hypothetical protein
MSEGNQTSSTVKLGLWLTFAAFVIVVLVFRSNLTELSFNPEGGMKATMAQDVSHLSDSERKTSEQDLLRRIDTLEKQGRANSGSTGNTQSPVTAKVGAEELPPQRPTFPNVAGNWSSPSGLVYQVTQFGNYVTVREMNPIYNVVTAVATGQIGGWSFSLPAYTLAGTRGTLSLQVSPDVRSMSGQYADLVTGAAVPMQLSR